jgi:hypothetical protein
VVEAEVRGQLGDIDGTPRVGDVPEQVATHRFAEGAGLTLQRGRRDLGHRRLRFDRFAIF